MSAKRDPSVYLEDILSAVVRIGSYAKKGKRKFFSDTMLQDAIIRQISIVGEAASKLPKSLRDRSADTPWKQIIGMRNIVIHDYSEIDLDVIWNTVEQELPLLGKQVKKLMRP